MKKKRVANALLEPEKDLELQAEDSKEYKVEAIINSEVYSQQANDQILGLQYLIS